MDDRSFQEIQIALDEHLDSLPTNASVGIKLGWNLYTEFRRRGLLKSKEADMLLAKFALPSYRDKFVADTFDLPDDEFRVGIPNA